MTVINLNLAGTGETVLNESNLDQNDLVNIIALGSSTLVIDGVNVSINSIAGVEAGSSPVFAVRNGGSLTLDQGLLNISALDRISFDVIGKGDVVLDGANVSTGLTNLLSDYDVDFSGVRVGSFTYVPPAVAVVDATSFTVSGMQPGDEFSIGSDRSWRLEQGVLRQAGAAYHDGALHLVSDGGLLGEDVRLIIPMTQEEADYFYAHQGEYLIPASGNDDGMFIFPGAIPCFVTGAMLRTTHGYCPVEDLRVGDMLITDGGPRRIIWIGSSEISARALEMRPNSRPIRLQKDCVGEGYPFADLLVSPQHRILVHGSRVKEMSGREPGLLAAKHLLDIPGIALAHDLQSVCYYHVLLEEHEVILANGIRTESLLIGPYIWRYLSGEKRKEVLSALSSVGASLEDGAIRSRHHLLNGGIAKRMTQRYGRKIGNYFADDQGDTAKDVRSNHTAEAI